MPYNSLDTLYRRTGNLEKALEEGRDAVRLKPDERPTTRTSAPTMPNLNRLEEAEAVYKEAESASWPLKGGEVSLPVGLSERR